jgi:hypothetical protein
VNIKQAVFLKLVCIVSLVTAGSVASAEDRTSAMPKDRDDTVQVPPIDEIIVSGRKDNFKGKWLVWN